MPAPGRSPDPVARGRAQSPQRRTTHRSADSARSCPVASTPHGWRCEVASTSGGWQCGLCPVAATSSGWQCGLCGVVATPHGWRCGVASTSGGRRCGVALTSSGPAVRVVRSCGNAARLAARRVLSCLTAGRRAGNWPRGAGSEGGRRSGRLPPRRCRWPWWGTGRVGGRPRPACHRGSSWVPRVDVFLPSPHGRPAPAGLMRVCGCDRPAAPMKTPCGRSGCGGNSALRVGGLRRGAVRADNGSGPERCLPDGRLWPGVVWASGPVPARGGPVARPGCVRRDGLWVLLLSWGCGFAGPRSGPLGFVGGRG